MLVDDKFKMKSRILVNDVKKVSFSPFADGMMIVHSEPQVSRIPKTKNFAVDQSVWVDVSDAIAASKMLFGGMKV